MKKIIKVSSNVDAKQLSALLAKGFKVVLVEDSPAKPDSDRLKGLERAASHSLKVGDIDRAKRHRLTMLKLLRK